MLRRSAHHFSMAARWHTEVKLTSSMVLQEIMGVLIGSAVAPIAMCLGWKKTNKWGAICGAVLGQWLGLIAWVVFAKVRSHHAPGLADSQGRASTAGMALL